MLEIEKVAVVSHEMREVQRRGGTFHIHLRGFFSSITPHVAAAVIPPSATSSKTSSGVPIGVILATRVRPLARTQVPLRPAASGRQPPPLGLRPKSFDANLSDSVREGRPRHSCYRPFRSSPAWPARLSSRHRLRHGSKGLQWADGSSTFLGRALRRREGGGRTALCFSVCWLLSRLRHETPGK